RWFAVLKHCNRSKPLFRINAFRVLTTSARKPPLRTATCAALWRIRAPVHPIRSSNWAESGYCELIRPQKGLTSNNEAGQRAETAWAKRQKPNLCLKNAPILTEVFGPMWLARDSAIRSERPIEIGLLPCEVAAPTP